VPVAVLPTAKLLSAFSLKPKSDRLLAREEQRVVVIVEPIALYMMRDLHEPKDGE
jgi:hypothetical protein